MIISGQISGAKKEPPSQKTDRTAPKNCLNNSRALPNKTRVLRQIAPESSPELRSRRPATGVSPRVSPENGVCLRECSTGCPGPGLRVSKRCLDTPGTLSGHLDTLGPGARRVSGTPRRTLPRKPPIFGDTLGENPGTLRARRARETPVAGRRDRNTRKFGETFVVKVLWGTLSVPETLRLEVAEGFSQ